MGSVFLESGAKTAKQLALRIGNGDASAETELVERYSAGLELILLKRTNNHQLTMDLCQDTFLIALKKLRAGKIYKPESLPGFLRQTAINLSIEHYRKEKRYMYGEGAINSLQATHMDKKAERIDRQHARMLLESVVDQLTQTRDRDILSRFYLLDQDKRQICKTLDLSAANFDRVLYRAKKRMCKMIEQQPELELLLLGSLTND
jgi:RNA polymerase sigma-70 factor (ECF subfamily)